MECVAGNEAARRQGPRPGRAGHLDQLRRAPRTRGAAHLPLCRYRRARARDCRQRLRLWHLRRVRQARSRYLVQEAARNGRRRRDRLQAPLGPCLAPLEEPGESFETAAVRPPQDEGLSLRLKQHLMLSSARRARLEAPTTVLQTIVHRRLYGTEE